LNARQQTAYKISLDLSTIAVINADNDLKGAGMDYLLVCIRINSLDHLELIISDESTTRWGPLGAYMYNDDSYTDYIIIASATIF
jgi:hypothetical protein